MSTKDNKKNQYLNLVIINFTGSTKEEKKRDGISEVKTQTSKSGNRRKKTLSSYINLFLNYFTEMIEGEILSTTQITIHLYYIYIEITM